MGMKYQPSVPAPLLERFRALTAAALTRGGDGFIREPNAPPRWLTRESNYTDSHLAILLWILGRTEGADSGAADRIAASRIRLWDRLQLPPDFFNAMAYCVLGILIRENGAHPDLSAAVEAVLRRRQDNSTQAWSKSCGNNMYLQQRCVDHWLAPLAEGRPPAASAAALLLQEFKSCLSPEGFFFDQPRPSSGKPRQYPFAYMLKCMFLLALCSRLHPCTELAALFRSMLEKITPFIAADGGFSYWGRTDNSTFAAGLAAFCYRAAVTLGAGGEARNLAAQADALFQRFPQSAEGGMEVNYYPLPAPYVNLVRSRDAYAYPWIYGISGACYCLLGDLLFPLAPAGAPAATPAPASVAHSTDLGLIRVRTSGWDLFLRTSSNLHSRDRRQFGPTILRLESASGLVVGAMPKTLSTDVAVAAPKNAGSLSRHLWQAVHYWKHGLDYLQPELVGFLPVVVVGWMQYVPIGCPASRTGDSSVTSEHPMVAINRRGLQPAMAHILNLVQRQFLKHGAPEPELTPRASGLRLIRKVSWTDSVIRIDDTILGGVKGARVLAGTRKLMPFRVETEGLRVAGSITGWSSDGPVEIQLYESACRETETAFSMTLHLATTTPAA